MLGASPFLASIVVILPVSCSLLSSVGLVQFQSTAMDIQECGAAIKRFIDCIAAHGRGDLC